MQHREIHRVQQAGQRDDREPDPFLLACPFDFVYASFQMFLAVRKQHEPPPPNEFA
jgi:hypothetical protein